MMTPIDIGAADRQTFQTEICRSYHAPKIRAKTVGFRLSTCALRAGSAELRRAPTTGTFGIESKACDLF
jgi:hypothetical protein